LHSCNCEKPTEPCIPISLTFLGKPGSVIHLSSRFEGGGDHLSSGNGVGCNNRTILQYSIVCSVIFSDGYNHDSAKGQKFWAI